MTTLNFKHLRYFWMVAKTGSVSRAAEQLHLTPHAISAQLGEFNAALGVELFRRAGRNLELTDAGGASSPRRRDLRHRRRPAGCTASPEGAQEPGATSGNCRFGVEVGRLPARRTGPRNRGVGKAGVREGRLAALLAELAIHRLDIIIADRPMPTNLNVRGYSHLLGESDLTVFGSHALAKTCPGAFRLHWTVRRSCCLAKTSPSARNCCSGSRPRRCTRASSASLTTAR